MNALLKSSVRFNGKPPKQTEIGSAKPTLTRGTVNDAEPAYTIAVRGQVTSNNIAQHLQLAARAVTAEDITTEDCPIIIEDDQSSL